ncbi:SpoIIAA family protein [Oceanomicrobium pacificus]|uniref:STAS/SEC14 domain-containing protein n=1 Tax=Oceanomicrobium pacificus TaxID=2692916 RepID=A0A6B0TY34_9RHOB|nr:STAS/SEC14 domain-containing protein [Oceanomicrobium pacificus]MXU66348.1 hypothetical protein [Oceanomicrobium pacificus]
MIDIETDPSKGLITASVDSRLTEGDMTKLVDAFNDYINAKDTAPRVVIHAKSFPGWDSFAAMSDHFKLVRNYEDLVPRIAVVSDSSVMAAMPAIATHFVGAQLRHFPTDEAGAARDWALSDAQDPLALSILDGFPADVIAMSIKGRLTSRDYDETLVPLVKKKLERHDKLKVLAIIDDDFGASAGAIWDDMRVGLSNPFRWRKMALVTDSQWMAQSARFFGPMVPGELAVFPSAERKAAEEWIRS